MKKCYNCGTVIRELPKVDRTKEHIPARTLFDGFPDKYKTNRLTVPACRECNAEYAAIDQEIRDYLAIITDGANSRESLRKAVRSIIQRGNLNDRLHKDIIGQVRGVNFSYDELKALHIKNFKGIYYHLYNHPVPGDLKIEVIADGDTHERVVIAGRDLFHALNNIRPWLFSGNEAVFRYNMGSFHVSDNAEVIIDNNPQGAMLIVAIIEYYETTMAIIVATPQLILDDIINQQNDTK